MRIWNQLISLIHTLCAHHFGVRSSSLALLAAAFAQASLVSEHHQHQQQRALRRTPREARAELVLAMCYPMKRSMSPRLPRFYPPAAAAELLTGRLSSAQLRPKACARHPPPRCERRERAGSRLMPNAVLPSRCRMASASRSLQTAACGSTPVAADRYGMRRLKGGCWGRTQISYSRWVGCVPVRTITRSELYTC